MNETLYKNQKVMKGKDINTSLVGTTGEYYVCAELGRKGILALLTPKNNPLFDIVAISKDAQRTIAIQVKTKGEGNNQGWRFGKDFDNPKNNPSLFVVLVNLADGKTEFYIYEYDTLLKRVQNLYKSYLEQPKRNGEKRKDVDFRWLNMSHFTDDDKRRKNSWEILGID
jgi:hypothetical protein